MLKIHNISSGYGKKQVLFDVSLEVKAGEVVLLTGGNGSGKSTLLKCVYNLLPLWKGAISINNERIDGLNPSDLIRKGIVYIPQKDFCFENLTVHENLQIAGNILPKQILKEWIEKIYEETGLKEFRKRKPFNLSGGEKKLLAFGMALLHEPKLVLFDEPLAGVDNTNSKTIINLMNDYFKAYSITAIIVEHKNEILGIYSSKINMYLGTIKNQ